MVFRSYTYSVLIVSSSDRFIASLSALLPSGDYYPVVTASCAAEARSKVENTSFDLIIISAPLSDEHGKELAADLASESSSGVLVSVPADDYDSICSALLEHGVMVISRPTSVQMITQTLRFMCAFRERSRSFEKKQARAEEKIEEMRLVNHAKALLIECLSMTENDAHKYIERQAMDMRRTRKEIAENIIKTYR